MQMQDEKGRTLGGRRPVNVSLDGTAAKYPESVQMFSSVGGTGSVSGAYTAEDNVNVTLLLSDSDSSHPATFTGYLQLDNSERIQIPAIRITGIVEETQTAVGGTIVQYGVPAGFTLIVEATRSNASIVSAKGVASP